MVVPKKSPLLSSTKPPWGLAPLVPLKEASVVITPLPATTSNTVPRPPGPPAMVVPKRSPLLSSIKPPWGLAPLVPLKEANVVMVPLPAMTSNTAPALPGCASDGRAEEVAAAVFDQVPWGLAPLVPLKEANVVMVPLPATTSNTVPPPPGPAAMVVPKRSPLLSSTSPPWGATPLMPLKEANVVMMPLPTTTSNTVPPPPEPPAAVVPKRSPLLSSIKPPWGKPHWRR